MRKPLLAAALAAVLTSASTSFGDTIMYSYSIPLATTDWSQTLSVPRFDPMLGTLNSIQFMVTGHIEGASFYENQESSPTDVSLTLSSNLSLLRPDMSIITAATPSTTVMETAGAYDGVLDFDGASGSYFGNLFADVTQTTTSPPPAGDLALFTGNTPISLTVSATGNSSGSGPGNWIFGFMLAAAADVKVTYDYAAVPEPASLGMVGIGAWLMFHRRRRD